MRGVADATVLLGHTEEEQRILLVCCIAAMLLYKAEGKTLERIEEG